MDSKSCDCVMTLVRWVGGMDCATISSPAHNAASVRREMSDCYMSTKMRARGTKEDRAQKLRDLLLPMMQSELGASCTLEPSSVDDDVRRAMHGAGLTSHCK